MHLAPKHLHHLLAAKMEAAYFLAVSGLEPAEDEILEAEASFHQRFGAPKWGRAFYVFVKAEIEEAHRAELPPGPSGTGAELLERRGSSQLYPYGFSRDPT